MTLTNHLNLNFGNFRELNDKFVGNPPFPMIVLDNFLPLDMVKSMEEETKTVPDYYWKDFTRRGSFMKELNQMNLCPSAAAFVNQMHSQSGMTWLINLTGIKDLIPDPYLIGAGYSKSFRGHSLKIHTDFNWNDTIKVHRMASMIVYLTDDWQEDWGGNLQFKDFDNQNIVQNIVPKFNRAVIWRYHKRGFHGFPEPLNCPEGVSRTTFRLFFYVSNAKPDDKDRPHRSLYWFDKEIGEPYDIPTHR